MKATLSWLGALLVVAASASLAHAGPFCPSCSSRPPQMAYGWGGGYAPQWGAGYAPNYCTQMPAQPYGGFQPPAGLGCGLCNKVPGFPVHPYARSPRDFFMAEDP